MTFSSLFLLAVRAASYCGQALQDITDYYHARALQAFTLNGGAQAAQRGYRVALGR